MRSIISFGILGAALFLTACESATDASACRVVPTREIATRGDTVRTVTGLEYLELRTGTGEAARVCTMLEVAYTGRLENGAVFDHGTLQVIPGTRDVQYRVIPGFEQVLVGMRVGGERRAIIPPALGYGSQARDRIPANSTLIFDVELLGVEPL